MTNVLEGMKGLLDGKIVEVEGYYISELLREDIKPLLKFPDKDSEGNDCWSGDLVRDNRYFDKKNNIFFIYYNGYKWIVSHVPVELEYFKVTKKLPNKDRMLLTTRLCSIYDKEALDHLPEDVVSKLKEEV